MFTHLGLDWGSKRIGIAYGDPNTGLVIPAEYECFNKDFFLLLNREIVEKKITTIVIGNPTNFKLQNTKISSNIHQFITDLQIQFPSISVIQMNENGSTQFAKNLGIKNKTAINHAAAVDILERYFYKLKRSQ